MSELEPTPELPDDMAIREVRSPTRIKSAGLKTVGEVREISDQALLALPDFGTASVAHLRQARNPISVKDRPWVIMTIDEIRDNFFAAGGVTLACWFQLKSGRTSLLAAASSPR
jgi:hypothetical protein